MKYGCARHGRMLQQSIAGACEYVLDCTLPFNTVQQTSFVLHDLG